MCTLSRNLTLRNVGVQMNGQQILHKLNVTFEHQKIYTVVGPSGTGKTTLLRVLAGLTPWTSGEIVYKEEKYQPKNHCIGLVPQNYGLLPWQTIWEAVAQAKKISNKKKKLSPNDKQSIQQLLIKMGLQGVQKKYPKELSGGQQQRVSIARAFASNTELLLMDEPFSALDAFTRENMQQLFLDRWQEKPQITVFITHDIEEAVLLGEKVIIMKNSANNQICIWDNPVASLVGTITEKRGNEIFFQTVKELRREMD